jgi:aspartyl-tRNA(Asn)/glutamyl-tRNA(Gln) amidotransferase subunit A
LLRDLGATLQSVSTPLAKHALSAYYIIASAEACSNLARFDGARYGCRVDKAEDETAALTAWERTRGAGMGAEVKKRVLTGSYALSAE